MAGLLVDKLYNPSGVVITDMETHMSHINHNIELNAGQFVWTFFLYMHIMGSAARLL